MRVVVTGSSGLIGSALVEWLRDHGHSATRLVRRPPGDNEVRWDPAAGTIDEAGLEGHDAVVHLAGEGVAAKRWTHAQKARVKESRVKGTTLLSQALASLTDRPAVLVSGSAVGYYGDRGDEVLDESSSSGSDFLAEICREWEAAAMPAETGGIRTVNIRTGIVLSPAGGALRKQLPLFRLGLGGPLAGGRHWMSWISIEDQVRAIVHMLTEDGLAGPVNLTAPSPVTNKEFTAALGRVLHRPAFVPVPRFALAIALGSELAGGLTASQRVLPRRLQESGFEFRQRDIESAFGSMLGQGRR